MLVVGFEKIDSDDSDLEEFSSLIESQTVLTYAVRPTITSPLKQASELLQDYVVITPLTISPMSTAINSSVHELTIAHTKPETQISPTKPQTENIRIIEVFTAYALYDERLKRRIEQILSTLERQGKRHGWSLICTWIEVAADEASWKVDNHLETANLILFLVSPDLLDTDFCYDKKIEAAVKRHEERTKCHIVPIIIRPTTLWKDTPFAHLPHLPKNAKAVSQYSNEDEAIDEIAEYIKNKLHTLKPYV